jgi:FtsX-like permease family protein/ankyrin repeat protein
MTVHRSHPPARAMRESPDIDQLRRQARELLEAYRAQSPDAIIEVAAHHRTATPETFALHDAQFVLARSYGLESWPKLKAAVEGVTIKRLHEAVKNRDLGAVRALLARRPEIVDLLPGGPSGSEIRALHIAVMARDVEMTRLLLEAGADTRGGIWPNREATSPRTIAEERSYDEIVALMAPLRVRCIGDSSSSVRRSRRPPSLRRRSRFSSIRYAMASRSRRSSQPVRTPSTKCSALGSITSGAYIMALAKWSADLWNTTRVISYSVTRQQRELGIQLALGARRSHVTRTVLRRGTRLMIVGAAIGLALAVPTTRAIGGLLFGIQPMDAASSGS